MRIAIDGRYIQDHFPGIGRYTFNLIRHLPAVSEHRYVVFHNPALRNTRYDLAELVVEGKVALVELSSPTFSLSEQWRLPRAALRAQADLLHSPYYIKPYLPALPSVTTVYDAISDHYPAYLPSRRARWLYRLTMRLALATSRRVLTLSRSSSEDLSRYYGTAQRKVSVAYLAADQSYHPLARGECHSLAVRYALPRRFALYVGINKPHKNLALLIEALAVARSNADVHVVIAGAHDPRWPEAQQAVARLGLEEVVRFLPNVPEGDLPLLYNLADFFLFPSLCEGFGLPPLEAMACGLAVICSNRSSLPEVVGDAAMLLDPHDTEAWATAMVDLWQSSDTRAQLSEKSLRRASIFSWEETARQTVRAYQEAMRS